MELFGNWKKRKRPSEEQLGKLYADILPHVTDTASWQRCAGGEVTAAPSGLA